MRVIENFEEMCTDKGRPTFVESVGDLVAAAEQEADGKHRTAFRILAATAFLVAATSWQPKGKFSKSKALLATAMSHLHLAAGEAAIDLKVR